MTETLDFDARADLVADYDCVVRIFMPAYEASHDLAAVLLAEAGERGHLLAIGAGGGAELARFAAALPQWRFTGVDPSADMLTRAQQRLKGVGAFARVSLVKGIAQDAPVGPFDAATAFLALPFVADDGERLAQLRAIHKRLKPGAPFLMIHPATDDFERDLQRYADHARLHEVEPGMLAEAVAMQRGGVHILKPARETALLEEAGFGHVEIFLQAFWIHGWRAVA